VRSRLAELQASEKARFAETRHTAVFREAILEVSSVSGT
jgi:hypothetical protein